LTVLGNAPNIKYPVLKFSIYLIIYIRSTYNRKISISSAVRPLVYKKRDDNFVLYSVGPNFKDDDGEVFQDEKGGVRKWVGEGDWVFWPIQKN
jgi:hypothetical protein